MRDKEKNALAYQVLEYVKRLQNDRKVPQIPDLFANDADFLQYHKQIVELRAMITALSKGDLQASMSTKGFIAGSCKSLQANLRHVLWMVEQVEAGDYAHRLDFLGDLSTSFNNMVVRLKTTMDALRENEEILTELAGSLQKEAQKRSKAMRDLKKSEQRFKHLSERDSLTELLNRRAFFSLADTNLKDALSLDASCCVCLIDVDNFKKFNDTFGHLEGDRALQHVARHSLATLRQTDIMGRYGGEEFIILFTGMGEAQGYAAAERVRLGIENCAFSLENGDIADITVSVGLAVILPDSETSDIAQRLRVGIAQADAALYRAKTQGKNRTILFTR